MSLNIVQTHRIYSTKSEPQCKLCTLGDTNVVTVVSFVITDGPLCCRMLTMREAVCIDGESTWDISVPYL